MKYMLNTEREDVKKRGEYFVYFISLIRYISWILRKSSIHMSRQISQGKIYVPNTYAFLLYKNAPTHTTT